MVAEGLMGSTLYNCMAKKSRFCAFRVLSFHMMWHYHSVETIKLFWLFLQGRFEILSLCGSFMPTDNGGTKSRSGGMSVSLAGPDGRVVGGGLAGLLVAAGPVQVHLFPLDEK